MSTSSSPSSSVPTTPTGQRRMSYADGCIYQVRCTLEDHEALCYVGSTTTTLAKRLYQHRVTSKDPSQTRRLYAAMRELGATNFRIDPLEYYPCERREQLRAREEHWRRELEAPLNTIRAYRTEEEAREENKEFCKRWYAANRERHLTHQKARNDALRAIGFHCTTCNHTFTRPYDLKQHYATHKHKEAAMKAHLTALFREARAAHRSRQVAAFQTRLTAALVATAAERDTHRSQLTA